MIYLVSWCIRMVSKHQTWEHVCISGDKWNPGFSVSSINKCVHILLTSCDLNVWKPSPPKRRDDGTWWTSGSHLALLCNLNLIVFGTLRNTPFHLHTSSFFHRLPLTTVSLFPYFLFFIFVNVSFANVCPKRGKTQKRRPLVLVSSEMKTEEEHEAAVRRKWRGTRKDNLYCHLVAGDVKTTTKSLGRFPAAGRPMVVSRKRSLQRSEVRWGRVWVGTSLGWSRRLSFPLPASSSIFPDPNSDTE